MAFRLGDIATGARALRPCWPKETHPSQGQAEAHLRALTRRDARDASDLNTYACRWCSGWHVGHRPLQKEEEENTMSIRLINLFVKSVSLVKKPANKRKFLVIKTATEGSMHMRALTFEEAMEKNRERDAARKTTAPATPTLTNADVDTFLSSMREALRSVTPVAKAAVDEVEARIAARIDRNPASVTRAVAMQEVFSADPALYEKYRRENTIGRDGQAMSADPAFRDVGIGRVTAKSESVDAEVARRVNALVSKSSGATVQQALAFIGREDPALMTRWMRESYAEQM